MNRTIVVCFPGMGYTCDRPLLKTFINYYKELNATVRTIHYDDITFDRTAPFADALALLKKPVLKQIADIDFTQYEEIVFLSKSIGTMVAAWLKEELHLQVKQLFLTPLPDMIKQIADPLEVIGTVIGTKDKYLDYKILQEHCKKAKIPCVIIPDVGHSLEYKDDTKRTKEVTEYIVSYFKRDKLEEQEGKSVSTII